MPETTRLEFGVAELLLGGADGSLGRLDGGFLGPQMQLSLIIGRPGGEAVLKQRDLSLELQVCLG